MPHELYPEEVAKRILLQALELRDHSFTHQQLEAMAAELDIAPEYLEAAIQRLEPQAVQALAAPSAPTYFVHPRGLLVTAEHLVIHGRIHALAGVERAEKRVVQTPPPWKPIMGATIAIIFLLGVLFGLFVFWSCLVLFFFAALFVVPTFKRKLVAVILHSASGPQSVYMLNDESLIEELVAAVNTALTSRQRLTAYILSTPPHVRFVPCWHRSRSRLRSRFRAKWYRFSSAYHEGHATRIRQLDPAGSQRRPLS